MDITTIAMLMSKELGFEITVEQVAKLPDDGCPGHMNLGHWDVFAARAGEFVMLAYAYDDGSVSIHIV